MLRAWRGEHGNWCPGHQRRAHPAHDLTVDHVVPLAAGGAPFDIANTAVLCSSCNSTKGASSDSLWREAARPDVQPSRLGQGRLGRAIVGGEAGRQRQDGAHGVSDVDEPVAGDRREGVPLRVGTAVLDELLRVHRLTVAELQDPDDQRPRLLLGAEGVEVDEKRPTRGTRRRSGGLQGIGFELAGQIIGDKGLFYTIQSAN